MNEWTDASVIEQDVKLLFFFKYHNMKGVLDMDLYSNVVKKIEALGYFETREDPRLIADSIGHEIRKKGVVEGRIDLYYKSESGPYIETDLKGKRILIALPYTWRFIEDIEPSEGNFKNIEIFNHICSVDLSKKTQHEVDMEVLLSEVWGVGDHNDTQLPDEMEWPSPKVD